MSTGIIWLPLSGRNPFQVASHIWQTSSLYYQPGYLMQTQSRDISLMSAQEHSACAAAVYLVEAAL